MTPAFLVLAVPGLFADAAKNDGGVRGGSGFPKPSPNNNGRSVNYAGLGAPLFLLVVVLPIMRYSFLFFFKRELCPAGRVGWAEGCGPILQFVPESKRPLVFLYVIASGRR